MLAIGQKAEEEPKYRFFDLYGMINESMLIDCLERLCMTGGASFR